MAYRKKHNFTPVETGVRFYTPENAEDYICNEQDRDLIREIVESYNNSKRTVRHKPVHELVVPQGQNLEFTSRRLARAFTTLDYGRQQFGAIDVAQSVVSNRTSELGVQKLENARKSPASLGFVALTFSEELTLKQVPRAEALCASISKLAVPTMIICTNTQAGKVEDYDLFPLSLQRTTTAASPFPSYDGIKAELPDGYNQL